MVDQIFKVGKIWAENVNAKKIDLTSVTRILIVR